MLRETVVEKGKQRQELKQRRIGSGESFNDNCGANFIDSKFDTVTVLTSAIKSSFLVLQQKRQQQAFQYLYTTYKSVERGS